MPRLSRKLGTDKSQPKQWATGVQYRIDDVVHSQVVDATENLIYRCTVDHVSGASLLADIANWSSIGGGTFIQDTTGFSDVVKPDYGTTAALTDDFLFGADAETLLDPLNYDGVNSIRMFFDKSKGAFRVGDALTEWDDINRGSQSMAWGINTTASGTGSTAWGLTTEATNTHSTAWGQLTESSSLNTTAFGFNTQATFSNATAWGDRTIASGTNSTAWGVSNRLRGATGTNSTSWGDETLSSGTNTTTFGRDTRASGSQNTAFGFETRATGTNATAWGDDTEASQFQTTAFGNGTTASGTNSTAWGNTTTASGGNSTAWGVFNSTAGDGSSVFGSGMTLSAAADGSVGIGLGGGGSNAANTFTVTTPDVMAIMGGNVGIGTVTPSVLLNTEGGDVLFDGTSAVDSGDLLWDESLSGLAIGRAVYDLSGIGADTGLTVGGDGGVANAIAIFNTSADAGFASLALGDGSGAGNPAYTHTYLGTGGDNQSTSWEGRSLFIVTETANAITGVDTVASSGRIVIRSEDSTGAAASASGNLNLSTGDNAAVDAGSSTGDISLTVGSVGVGAIQGDIKFLKTGVAPTIGDVWTATAVDGEGYWAAPAGGGTFIVDTTGDDNDVITPDSGISTIATDDFLFGAPVFAGVAPADDPLDYDGLNSIRMFFDKSKGAFRVGDALAEWDDINRGSSSMAWGLRATASGGTSTAWGRNTIASGTNSTAWGQSTIASGQDSTAWGVSFTASGAQSTAWGMSTSATGAQSTAWGLGTVASAFLSTTFGRNTTASGNHATAWGFFSTASGPDSTAFGSATASGPQSLAFGFQTTASNGSATAFGAFSTATGAHSTAFGNNSHASADRATAWGTFNLASGTESTAWGFSNTAAGETSTVFGSGMTLSAAADGSVGIGLGGAGMNAASTFTSADVGVMTIAGGSVLIDTAVGAKSITASSALEVNSTTGAILFPRMTDAEKLLLIGTDGMIIYDTDVVAGGEFQGFVNGAWVSLGGGGGGYTWASHTVDYTAVDNDGILADNSGATILTGITLPDMTVPVDGTKVKITDGALLGSFAANPVDIITIDGSTLINTASPFTMDTDYGWIEAVYDAANTNWVLMGPGVGPSAGASGWTSISLSASQSAVADEEYITDGTAGIIITCPAPALGLRFRVIDGADDWATDNVTIAPSGGEQIDFVVGNLVLNTDRAWVELVSDGTNWFVYRP